MKRSRLRRVSKKRAKLMRQVSGPRQDYLREHPYCACCNDPSQCVHEIASGPAREKSLGERKAWLAVCVACNTYRLTNYDEWPIARQLAAKAFQDPSYLDIERVCELRGRDPKAISVAEVVRAGRTITVKYVGEFE